MFERFTERARQVVVLAQDEARSFGHAYIGTEHLLLGILRENEGLGARTLESLGVVLDDARDRVRTIVGEGEPIGAGQIPFMPPAKEALELALREAQALGHNFIGTEHLLLGLVRADEGVASEILTDLGRSPDYVREEVIRQLGGQNVVAGVPRATATRPRKRRVSPLVGGTLLFAVALALGILIGWAIWH